MRPEKRRQSNSGFTLIELMIVVVILGMIAAIALPNYISFTKKAKIARTAKELQGFGDAFVAYMAGDGQFPPDSHIVLPPGMDVFIKPSVWGADTPIGGNYNWEGPDFYPYAGISITGAVANADLVILDQLLDDGNLGTGKFRTGTSGRPTYIISE